MNYYEHHIGDFLKKTVHLTAVEEGIYRRLLDRYYTTEAPLPADLRECCKLARASTKPERDAVKAVLTDFFQLQDDGYHQRRADEEIARFKDKQAKAKRSAEARWSAHRPQSEGNANAYANASPDSMRTHCEGNAPRARPHTPDTSNQSPDPIHTHSATATDAGRVCRAMKRAGLPDVNPGHPDLLALIDAGASDAEFTGAATTAAERGKGFAYAIGMLKRQRAEAKATAGQLHRGPMPAAETPTQRAHRERAEAFAPSVAAKAPQGTTTPTAEVIDVASRLVG